VRGIFILPLYPLDDVVLLPGERLSLRGAAIPSAVLDRARGFGGAVVASLVDGESVHEVGVTALVSADADGEAELHGVSRCRLLSLVSEDATLVRVEQYPETAGAEPRSRALSRLLLSRFERFRRQAGKTPTPPPARGDLSALTWRITAEVGLSTEQQQGLLNVPDPLTRGRLLLLALREVERRERFLRPWAHLRREATWN
jgi:Lon protease-like protein